MLSQPQVTPCDDIENIIGDFGFVQGSMGPAVSSPVLRQLASAMDSVLSDLDTLSNAIPACNKGSSEKVCCSNLYNTAAFKSANSIITNTRAQQSVMSLPSCLTIWGR